MTPLDSQVVHHVDTSEFGVFPHLREKDLYLRDTPTENIRECGDAESLQTLKQLQHVESTNFFLRVGQSFPADKGLREEESYEVGVLRPSPQRESKYLMMDILKACLFSPPFQFTSHRDRSVDPIASLTKQLIKLIDLVPIL